MTARIDLAFFGLGGFGVSATVSSFFRSGSNARMISKVFRPHSGT